MNDDDERERRRREEEEERERQEEEERERQRQAEEERELRVQQRLEEDVVHPLVDALVTGYEQPSPRAFAEASNLADRILFAGYRGPLVRHDDGRLWRLLYLDLELTEWLLIEDSGIVAESTVVEDASPFNQERNVVWVKADAAVGRGSASQAVQAQFLTGKFTRAGDFEAPLSGGTLAAATGVFCEARTPSCCRVRSRPY